MRRFSLATKLAVLLSALSLALVLIILLAIKTTFDLGFERYINQAIAERMDDLVIRLGQQPRAFERLLRDPRLWDRYLRGYLREPDASKISEQHSNNANADDEPERAGPPRRDMARWSAVRRSIWLLGPNGEYYGREPLPPAERLRFVPIMMDGEQIGSLAWRPIKARDSAMDAHFAERQHLLFGWIALFAVLASCLLAWPLSRYLVNPVRRLSLAMGALMQRDYARRVPVNSTDELGDLARDFNLMAQTLEEQDRQQRQWLADISHELRTPLGVMKGELEAVEDGVMPFDDARVRSLGEEVNQLTRLVDDLHQLAITQVSHLRYEWKPLELTTFIRQMAVRLSPLLQQAKLTWTLDAPDEPLWIRADDQRLEQLIMNLAQNSIRYTNTGGAVRVTLRQLAPDAERRAPMISLAWEDSAPGVAAQDLDHIFDRFYRVEHSRQRALGGSGLGLAIVANIAEAHGATLAAQASPLGGLHITLMFAVAEKPRS